MTAPAPSARPERERENPRWERGFFTILNPDRTTKRMVGGWFCGDFGIHKYRLDEPTIEGGKNAYSLSFIPLGGRLASATSLSDAKELADIIRPCADWSCVTIERTRVTEAITHRIGKTLSERGWGYLFGTRLIVKTDTQIIKREASS